MTLLSVNVNKIAVLRNSRGGRMPDPVQAARVALEAGCDGITVHPRPDERHIRVSDVPRIGAVLGGAEYNLEGNPFAPPRGTYPGFLSLVRAVRPAQVTLVPDADGQITSDHGFDLARDGALLGPMITQLKSVGASSGSSAITRDRLSNHAATPPIRPPPPTLTSTVSGTPRCCSISRASVPAPATTSG